MHLKEPITLSHRTHICTPTYMYVSCGLLEYARTFGIGPILARWRSNLRGFSATLRFGATEPDLHLFNCTYELHFLRRIFWAHKKSGNSGSLKVTRFWWNPPVPLLHPRWWVSRESCDEFQEGVVRALGDCVFSRTPFFLDLGKGSAPARRISTRSVAWLAARRHQRVREHQRHTMWRARNRKDTVHDHLVQACLY